MREPKIIEAALPDGLLGFTDGIARIWLDRELTAVDRRVVLDHELIHYSRGHRGHCVAVIERDIDRDVARGLIHVTDLGEAIAWSEHIVVIAEELDVMPDTVIDRLHTLTAGERAALEARVAEAHWVA